VAIAGIGFRADGQALAERLGLGRIDHRDRSARLKKPERHRLVIDPGRFQNQMNLTQGGFKLTQHGWIERLSRLEDAEGDMNEFAHHGADDDSLRKF